MQQLIRSEDGKTSDDVPNAPPPFHYPVWYVIDTWLERRLHRIYPNEGGYNNQDAFLMDDWRTLNLYYLRVKAGVVSILHMPHAAHDWSSLMGE